MLSKSETQKLKSFLKDNFHYPSLKKAGFFKDISSTDYEAQANRICKFFGYSSIYEYKTPHYQHGDFHINGKDKDSVNSNGELVKGASFHLSLAAQKVDVPKCPICSYNGNVASVYSSTKRSKDFKCKGCKRPIYVEYKDGEFLVQEK